MANHQTCRGVVRAGQADRDWDHFDEIHHGIVSADRWDGETDFDDDGPWSFGCRFGSVDYDLLLSLQDAGILHGADL